MATTRAEARLGEAASRTRPDATWIRLWIALTSKPRNRSPSTASPVSKLESDRNPRAPARSRARPASRQYHCAGVRRSSRAIDRPEDALLMGISLETVELETVEAIGFCPRPGQR